MQKITDFLFVPDSPGKADVTLVLGMTLWHRPAQRAVQLYRENRAGHLLFSGGYNEKIAACEAENMAVHAKEAGVAEGAFFVEARSRNTRENFLYCRQLLEEQSIKHDHITIVAIGFHMRRALLTAQDVFPPSISFGTASYPSIHYASESWQSSERGRGDVLTEMRKIARYFPQSISPELLSLAESLA